MRAHLWLSRVLCVMALVGLVACGSTEPGTAPDDVAAADQSAGDVATGNDATDAGVEDAGPVVEDGTVEDTSAVVDATEPPPGQEAFPTYSAGTCPELQAGSQSFMTGSSSRSIYLTLPANPEGAPVVFLFHGLGDSAQNISLYMGGSAAANTHGAIVVAPQGGLSQFGWDIHSPSASNNDLAFFDDVLSCLDLQYGVDHSRIYASGFSAGALWTSYLVVHRAKYLASAATFSGGTGGVVASYSTPDFEMPVLVIWGGSSDVYGGFLNFQQTSEALSGALQSDGHFVVECNHGLGHTVPMGATNWLYPFLFSHSWGISASPYAAGLDAVFPSYCLIP